MRSQYNNTKINTDTNFNKNQGKNMSIITKKQRKLKINTPVVTTGAVNRYSNLARGVVGVLGILPILLIGVDALAFDLDAGIKAATDPVKKMINDYYPVGIFITGAMGAMMQQQGDLRDRMLGFGKGALVGGLTVIAVKTGLGV